MAVWGREFATGMLPAPVAAEAEVVDVEEEPAAVFRHGLLEVTEVVAGAFEWCSVDD